MGSCGPIGRALASVDERVDSTPETRNRAIDFLRVAAICVVVIWHWALSINHRRDGQLVNPNPVEQVPGGWLLTWVLQVMPIFFIIGGYANLTGWDSVTRQGGAAYAFLRRRMSRLLLPAAVFAAVWVLVELTLRLTLTDYAGALDLMPIIFTPLWFLGAYVLVTMLVPLTARLHRRFGAGATIAWGVLVVVVDLARFGVGEEWLGLANSALVWIFVHQLGYLWRDGSLDPIGRRWVLVIGGYAAVAAATTLDSYPRSMVAVAGEDVSHMWPTTAVIGALALGQTGLASLAAPALRRWMRHRAAYRLVVLLGGVLLTIFLWHMTALLIVFLMVEALGFTPGAEPTLEWWLLRPFWVVAPALVLVVFVALFAPIEQRIRRALSLT
ncbi:acyltransferase [Phytoactinopolyspora alkaliphila]|uniref:Acyltransferase n=1 Tax=Phytoactinopolyspora alkaliphila TaxID=1783498 RepID=A0A6N9YL66_9ACTN|nr:acyltransferase [Phytoactinopolyspora alkaliphila]NED95619.1 acyltransferase [Phytoactinopolyspora alkaliphila]